VSIEGGEERNLSKNLDHVTDYRLSPDGKFAVLSVGASEFQESLYIVSLMPNPSDDLCLPIRAINGNTAVICL